MAVSASQLRQDIYRLLDRVLKTGKALEIRRGGRLLKIVPVEPEKKLASLEKRNILKGNPEDLVHVDWSGEWKPGPA
jgi:antitoxin (DNA-binding transcriptional repressor) of toxin-antitoxin stability system